MKQASGTRRERPSRFYEVQPRAWKWKCGRIEAWYLLLEAAEYPDVEPCLPAAVYSVQDGVLRPQGKELD